MRLVRLSRLRERHYDGLEMPTVLAAGTEGSPPPLALEWFACTFIVYTLILTTEMNPHVMSGAKAGRVGEPAGLLRGRLPYRIGLFELEPSAIIAPCGSVKDPLFIHQILLSAVGLA